MEHKKLEQHQEMAAVMSALSNIRQKISRMNAMFPQYCVTLENEYNEIVHNARSRSLVPPWMKV